MSNSTKVENNENNREKLAEEILEEFVEDVQAADAEKVKKEWPDLHHTYKKACRALDVEEDDENFQTDWKVMNES